MDVDEDQQARAALGRASVLSKAVVERGLLASGTTGLFLLGYFGAGAHAAALRVWDLGSPWDARIPFVADSIWVYLALFPMALLPLFLVRCPRLFRRTIAAYALAIVISVVVFAVFPVTSVELRADTAALDVHRFAPWTVATLYRIDPPFNLFPSLHLSIALLAALSAWRASKAFGAAALALCVPVAASIATVKQHFVVDGIAGLALASILYGWIVSGYQVRPGQPPAYGWRGPAAFALFTAALYGALFLVFRSQA